MKVLIDQNISHRIIPFLAEYFDILTHVRETGLMNSYDYQIFMYARETKYDAILTLDEDFQHHILIHNAPPKVIWLRVGNCSTKHLSDVIIQNIGDINAFVHNDNFEIIEIY